MANKIREMLGLDLSKRLTNTKIASNPPCKECEVHKKYMETAIYGSVAERQCMETPEECESCIKIINHKIDCITKLAWYENHDERLK